MAFAFVFPGQGSQAVGMGRDLADAFPSARHVFQEVDDALGQKLSKLMWEGPQEELTLTANAQPALMAHSLAVVRALEAEGGFGRAARVALVAGHSLGEYSALTAAGAFDIATAERALAAVKNHRRFGFNYDPSHLGYQGVDYVAFIRKFGPRIFHAHIKDAWWGHGDGSVGVFGGHTTFGDARRQWDFRSVGRGDINFEEVIVALNEVGYQGPLSVEWEDIRMDRIHGATESAAFVRQLDFYSSAVAFDAAFDKKKGKSK